MAPDLMTQLRAYAERLDREAPPLGDLLPTGRLAPAPRPVLRRRRWLGAVVAALAVLVLVGGPSLLVSRRPADQTGPYGPPPAFRATIERRIPSEAVAEELAAIAEEQGEPAPAGPTSDRVVVLQLSFDGTEGWRLDFVSDSFPMPGRPEESVGSFWVTHGEIVVQYLAESNTVTDAPELPSPLDLLTWDGTATAQQFWTEQCPDPSLLPDEEVAGRTARHAGCGPWEVWVDAETGLLLRLRLAPGPPFPVPSPSPVGVAPGQTLEVTEVEYQPTFPEETFELAGPPGAEPPGEEISEDNVTRFVVGEEAPTWTAPLLSGEELDLASLRGKPVALLFWASWCPICLDDAELEEGEDAPFAPFETAYQEHQDAVHFVSVAYEDDPEAVRRFLEETGRQISLPVAFLSPSETGEGWVVMAIPTLIFLDEEGRFLGGHLGVFAADDLARAVEALAAGEPLPEPFIPKPGQSIQFG